MEAVRNFILGGSKITADGDWIHEIKRCLLLGRKAMTNLDSTLKSRYYFANKDPSSQSYGFSSSQVWMWELDYKESWMLKNWCFWTVMLEKTLESPLDCEEIQPVHPKGDQSWVFIRRTDVEAKTPYFGHLMRRADSLEKTLMLGGIGGRRRRGRQRMRWLDGITGRESQWTPGVGDGQGGMACCDSGGLKESDRTEIELNWTERLNWLTELNFL